MRVVHAQYRVYRNEAVARKREKNCDEGPLIRVSRVDKTLDKTRAKGEKLTEL